MKDWEEEWKNLVPEMEQLEKETEPENDLEEEEEENEGQGNGVGETQILEHITPVSLNTRSH